jgi:hypothetical protein
VRNEAEAIATALGEIPGIALVTRGWPTDFARIPCLSVQLLTEIPADSRDDDEYLTELEYYIHIFCNTMKECDTFTPIVDAEMKSLGYTRTHAYEDNAPGAAHLVRRYRKRG